jgi:hypothetical protein
MLGNPTIRSALVSLLVCAVSLHQMQGQGVATARISGTLTDDSGAVLVGATVQATHLDREVTRNLYLTAEEKHVFGPGAVSLFRVSFVRNYSNGITKKLSARSWM